MAPPEVSGARLAVLRTAFERMMKDPAFSDEGRKLNLELVFGSGEHLAQAVDWIYTMPQDVIMECRWRRLTRTIRAESGEIRRQR